MKFIALAPLLLLIAGCAGGTIVDYQTPSEFTEALAVRLMKASNEFRELTGDPDNYKHDVQRNVALSNHERSTLLEEEGCSIEGEVHLVRLKSRCGEMASLFDPESGRMVCTLGIENRFLPSVCIATKGISCMDFGLTDDTLEVVLTNNQGVELEMLQVRSEHCPNTVDIPGPIPNAESVNVRLTGCDLPEFECDSNFRETELEVVMFRAPAPPTTSTVTIRTRVN